LAAEKTGRGALTSIEVRTTILSLVNEAVASGCRRMSACDALSIGERTLQRWKQNSADNRRGPITAPKNKLTKAERDLIVKTSSSAEYVNLSPHQIVPKLADLGTYIPLSRAFIEY